LELSVLAPLSSLSLRLSKRRWFIEIVIKYMFDKDFQSQNKDMCGKEVTFLSEILPYKAK
jgi:hypothetical protein